jgi:hypothetical protein
MSFTDSLIEILRTTGAGTGTVGGGLVVAVYKRFQTAEQAALGAAKKIDDLKVEYTATINSLKSFLSTELEGFKRNVDNQLATIARGSKADITVTVDQKTLERILELETRMSSMEDDVDVARKEDRDAWGEILRSIGRLEGQLSSRRNP